MSSTNRQTNNIRSGMGTTTATTGHPYFLFIITNYPNLLPQTYTYQPPNQYWQQQRQQGGILIPGVRVHFGTVHTNIHERLLYNTLRFQIEQIIRTYLYQTHQLHPIYLFFDMSHINSQL